MRFRALLALLCLTALAITTAHADTPQAEAKHLLLECAHRLDTRDVRAHKKTDGLLLVSARGSCRYATWRERLAYWIAGTLPREI